MADRRFAFGEADLRVFLKDCGFKSFERADGQHIRFDRPAAMAFDDKFVPRWVIVAAKNADDRFDLGCGDRDPMGLGGGTEGEGCAFQSAFVDPVLGACDDGKDKRDGVDGEMAKGRRMRV